MKTVITYVSTVQTGIDSFKDVRISRVFEDTATILEIKLWWRGNIRQDIPIREVGVSIMEISDIEE